MNALGRRLLAGGLVGFAGAIAFGVVHAILIAPVLPPFLVGAVAAPLAGVAVGWAWHTAQTTRPLRGVHVGLALAALLVPAGIASLLGLVPDDAGPAPRLAVALLPALLALAMGWAWTRTQGAVAFGLAGGILGFSLGAQIAGTNLLGWAGAFYLSFIALTVLAGVALEKVEARLGPR